VGTDHVLISAWQDDTGSTDAGSVYLFTLGYPPLSITSAGTNYSVTWSTFEPGLILQQADVLSDSTIWVDVASLPTISGPSNIFDLTVPGESTNRFYKLRRP
jgi:hypothetical protein